MGYLLILSPEFLPLSFNAFQRKSSNLSPMIGRADPKVVVLEACASLYPSCFTAALTQPVKLHTEKEVLMMQSVRMPITLLSQGKKSLKNNVKLARKGGCSMACRQPRLPLKTAMHCFVALPHSCTAKWLCQPRFYDTPPPETCCDAQFGNI